MLTITQKKIGNWNQNWKGVGPTRYGRDYRSGSILRRRLTRIYKFKAMSELAATVTATAVATAVDKGVAKDVIYLNVWWRGNLAIAVAIAGNSDTA